MHYIQFEIDNWIISRCFFQHWIKNYFCYHVVFIEVNKIKVSSVHRYSHNSSIRKNEITRKKAQKSLSESEKKRGHSSELIVHLNQTVI